MATSPHTNMELEDSMDLEAALAFMTEHDVSFTTIDQSDEYHALTNSAFTSQESGKEYQIWGNQAHVTDVPRLIDSDWDLSLSISGLDIPTAVEDAVPGSIIDTNGNTQVKNTSMHKLECKTNQTTKKKRAKRPSNRAVLSQLRSQVCEMEEKLRKLMIRDHNPPTTSQNGKQRRSLWKDIAERQATRRKKAELENQCLRRLVHVQTRAANRLRIALRKHATSNAIKSELGIAELGEVKAMKTVYLHEMVAEMDALYVDVDKILEADRLYQSKERICRRSCNLNAFESVLAEFIENREVPFDIHACERALWASFGKRGIHNSARGQKVDAQEQTFAGHWLIPLKDVASIYNGYAQVYRVTRKYVEANRIVFVFTMRVVVFLKGQDSSINVSYRFVRWCVLTRESEQVVTPKTRFKSHSIIVPHNIDMEKIHQFFATAYDLLVNKWEEYLDWNQELFESLLLEEALGHMK